MYHFTRITTFHLIYRPGQTYDVVDACNAVREELYLLGNWSSKLSFKAEKPTGSNPEKITNTLT